MKQVLAIISGGMDSVTLAHQLHSLGHHLVLVSFDYGQRHRTEIGFARSCAARLGVEHLLADVGFLRPLLAGSALTDDTIDVPEGHYAAPTMARTVVPNRNAIMLSVAVGIAVARRLDAVAIGVHAGDHAVYPDCRPEFIESFERAAKLGVEGFSVPSFQVLAPYVDQAKAGIVSIGDSLAVPWAETWSCYRGGEIHCGRCSTCVERQEAFHLAGVVDPTEYLDAQFWRSVIPA